MNISFTHFAGWLKSKALRAGLLASLIIISADLASAQALLCESFDGTTFPPTGWTTTTGGTGFTLAAWSRVTAGTFPSQSPHSGAGEADFNSFSATNGSAELRTPVISFTSLGTKQVTYWMYRDNGYSTYSSEVIDVIVNTTATATGGTIIGTIPRSSTLAPVVPSNGWYQYTFTVPATYNTATNYIIFRGTSQYGNDIYLDDICINNLPPCTGAPTAGILSPTGAQTACPGSSYSINATGTTVAGNLAYQFMQSTNGGVTWTPANGTGATTQHFTTAPITQNILYHFVVTCTTTGQKDSTANVSYTVIAPVYASVPYVQDFETWINGCGTTDLPSNNWTNQPYTGDASWRRDDQGASASWTSATSGVYTPAAAVGSHSARFHAYYATPNQTGSLSLYVNTAAFTSGQLELQLYLRTDPGITYPGDSLLVYQSNDGGQTFTPLVSYGPGTGGWDFHSKLFTGGFANTVLRFGAKTAYNYYTDMGVDYVRILAPCTGKPTAGAVVPVTPCANVNFNLALSGTSQAAGLNYQWQYLNAGGNWQNINPGNTSFITYNISTPTTVRAIVTCSNTSLADTTAPYLINLATFYNCYCNSAAQYNYSSLGPNIGNVTLSLNSTGTTVFSNGTATPVNNNPTAIQSYTNFRSTVAPVCIYRDSLYRISVAQINPGSFYASTATAFIDYNQDGSFSTGTPSERIFTKNTSTATNGNIATDTFRVPHTATLGTTGMRVILQYGTNVIINPCGTYSYGETEDYLINICYPPCSGPTDAGTAVATDTVVCPGYTIDLADTTHEKMRSGILYSWQVSYNGGVSWNHINGSNNKDTLNNVLITGPAQFRFRMRCTITGDTTYSNVINVTNGSNFQCYAVSQSTGNRTTDSSDIGAFSIGSYIMPVGLTSGPHLLNPLANRHHSDFTQQQNWIFLNADSTYPMAIYHTMRSRTHADALVTVFIDFNNDLQYTATSGTFPYGPERIFSGLSTANNWYLTTNVTMPNAVVPDVPTGLRVILNNDVNPNSPANLGAGTYISGETEDYVVVFHRYDPTKVGTTGLVKDIIMYPNPTDGRVTLGVNSAKDIAQMDVQVTNITGQVVMTRSYAHTGTQFTTELDLSGQARGVYFVEIRADGDRITRKLVVR